MYRPSTLSLIYGNHLRRALKNNDEITAVGDDFDQNDIPVHRLGLWRSQVAASAISRLPEHWHKAQLQARSRIQKLKQLPHIQVFEEQTESSSNFPFILLLADQPELAHAILAKLWTHRLGCNQIICTSDTSISESCSFKYIFATSRKFCAMVLVFLIRLG